MKWTIVVLGILGVLFLWFIGANNSQIQSANEVQNRWADVQSRYQRRLDLVDQLVSTVRGGAAQELAVFEALSDQAAGLSGQLSNNPPTEAEIGDLARNATAFNQAFVSVISYVADNPDIVSDQLFRDLMVGIEGSENRINIARDDYNAAVRRFRNSIQQFPGSVVASMGGRSISDFGYFEASEDAQNAPTIDFSAPPTAALR